MVSIQQLNEKTDVAVERKRDTEGKCQRSSSCPLHQRCHRCIKAFSPKLSQHKILLEFIQQYGMQYRYSLKMNKLDLNLLRNESACDFRLSSVKVIIKKTLWRCLKVRGVSNKQLFTAQIQFQQTWCWRLGSILWTITHKSTFIPFLGYPAVTWFLQSSCWSCQSMEASIKV